MNKIEYFSKRKEKRTCGYSAKRKEINMLPKEIECSMKTFIEIIFEYIYLSPELISIIYLYVLEEYCQRTIHKHCYNFIKTRNKMNCLILYCIRPDPEYIVTDDIFIESLKFLVNTHISRKYDLNLWATILQILSTEIYILRYTNRCNNISFKSPEGKKLKLVLDLWLQLCQKFNFKIFLQTKQIEKYVRATHILKMNNYDQYIIPPIVIQPFTYMQFIDINDARETMSYYLL